MNSPKSTHSKPGIFHKANWSTLQSDPAAQVGSQVVFRAESLPRRSNNPDDDPSVRILLNRAHYSGLVVALSSTYLPDEDESIGVAISGVTMGTYQGTRFSGRHYLVPFIRPNNVRALYDYDGLDIDELQHDAPDSDQSVAQQVFTWADWDELSEDPNWFLDAQIEIVARVLEDPGPPNHPYQIFVPVANPRDPRQKAILSYWREHSWNTFQDQAIEIFWNDLIRVTGSYTDHMMVNGAESAPLIFVRTVKAPW